MPINFVEENQGGEENSNINFLDGSENIYIEETNSVVKAPSGLNVSEIMFLDETQNQGQNKDGYFALTNIAQVPSAIYSGFKSAALSLPQTAGGLLQEQAETSIQILEENPGFAKRLEEGRIGIFGERDQPFVLPDNFLGRGFSSFKSFVDEKLGASNEEVLGKANVMIAKNQEKLKAAGLDGSDFDGIAKFGFDFGGGTASLFTALGISGITGSPLLASVFFGGIQKSEVYREAREIDPTTGEPKKTPSEASIISSKAGFMEAALESIGIDFLFRAMKGTGVVNRFIKGSATEFLQESAQGVSEEVITQFNDVREKGLGQTVQDILYQGFMGAILGGGSTSVGGAFVKKELKNAGLSAAQAEVFEKYFVDNIDAVIESADISEVIDAQISPIAENQEAEAVFGQMINDLSNGVEIDISNLSPSDKVISDNIAASINSAVEQAQLELDAQDGLNILPVPKKPETLAEFLKSKGGLKLKAMKSVGTTSLLDENGTVIEEEDIDLSGELRDLTRKEAPHLKGVANKNGTLTLEEALVIAIDEGFIPEPDPNSPTDIDIGTLLEAIHGEAVRAQDEGAALERDQVIEFNAQQDQDNQELLEGVRAVRSFKAAFKKGINAARQDVKASQEAIIDVLEKSPLDAKDRAKFIRTIKNIQTVDQLYKKSIEIQNRVEKLLDAAALRKQKEIFKGLLSSKSIKPTVQSDRKKGKFGAEIQERLETLKEASRLSSEQATEKLKKNINGEKQDLLENKILQVKAFPNQSTSTDYALINAEIRAIKTLGKALTDAKAAAKKEKVSNMVSDIRQNLRKKTRTDKALEKITGKEKKDLSERDIKDKKFRGFVGFAIDSYGEFIEKVVPASIRDEFSLGEAVELRKRIMQEQQQKIIEAGQSIFGKDLRALDKLFHQDHKTQDLGLFKNANGEVEPLKINVAQARKLWMAAQNESLLENTIMSKNGNAFTQEMLDAAFGILSEKDKAFAREQLRIYDEFYDIVNKVYSELYGINLGKAAFYSPISREKPSDIDQSLNQFMEEAFIMNEVASSTATKMRDPAAVAPIKIESDIAVFNNYMRGMSRFIAFGEKTRMLNSVFNDRTLTKDIKKKYGDSFNNNLHNVLRMVAGDTDNYNTPLDGLFNYFNRNFATSVLGGKAKIGLTQVSSYFSYAEFVGDQKSKAMIDGAVDFMKDPKRAIEILSETPFLKDRGSSPDVELARIGKAFDKKTLKKLKDGKLSIIEASLVFTRLGDRGTILFGGWAVYKYNIDQGKSHEEALAAFVEASRKTQQSKDIDQVSLMQGSSALGRSLAMFQTAPFAQYRGEMRAVRQFNNGEINAKQFGQQLMIYHVLIPQFYKLISNGIVFGEFDGEDQLWTLLFGSLNSIPILSEGINMGVRRLQGKSVFNPAFIKWGDVMREGIISGVDAIIAGLEGDFEAALEEGVEFSLALGAALGFATPQLEQGFEGIIDIADGETKQGAMKLAGHPDSVAESGGKKSKKKKSSAFNQ